MDSEMEYEKIIDKLAEIRDTYFDESDKEVEGHGMEDMIAYPYSVLLYIENKLKRQIKIIEHLRKQTMELQSEIMAQESIQRDGY